MKKGGFLKRKTLWKPPWNSVPPVRFRAQGRNRRLASFYFCLKSNFEKVRKTAKNEENPRKSRVFRPASFKTGTLGGTIQNRTGDGDFADRCLTAWLWCHSFKTKGISFKYALCFGAGNGARTRHLRLGKAALYQMSYSRSKCGASEWSRTTDTGIFSPLLYQLSYRGKKWRSEGGSNPWPPAWQAGILTNWTTGPRGGNNRARTYDPLLVRQMLSQLSYAPDIFLRRRLPEALRRD